MNRHILILPDSFKGTLSSSEAGEAIRLGIRDELPLARVDLFPMADGGEGSSSIIAATVGSQRQELSVFGPEGIQVPAFFYLTSDSPASDRPSSDSVAYIELAAASGYSLVRSRSRSARLATTYGTGELIHAALEKGAQKIFLFVGGSATTDGGVGIAKALGFRFFDAKGRELRSCSAEKPGDFSGERLIEIAKIERPQKAIWEGVEFVVVADVENPLFGPRGAAATYGPQKGASPEDVAYLDSGLKNLAQVVKNDLGLEMEQVPGAGAAGGSSYGMMCFLGATRLRGPSFFLDIIAFDERMKTVDCIITGEGRCDRQSVEGKLLAEIYRRSEAQQIRVISLCGEVSLSDEDLVKMPRLVALGLGQSDGLSNPSQALRRLSRQVAKLL